MFRLTSRTTCPKLTAERKDYATTHVVKMDTKHSPKPEVTQEGHCQPGKGPIPRTSQKVQKLAMQGYPWNSRKLYLQQTPARLSILILSKTYP
jgi:hypothetical protein